MRSHCKNFTSMGRRECANQCARRMRTGFAANLTVDGITTYVDLSAFAAHRNVCPTAKVKNQRNRT